MEVKRINTNKDEVTEFNFDVLASEFAIKNFTDSNILVCLGDFDENKTVKVPSMFLEIVSNNFNKDITNYTTKLYKKITVKSEAGGEVEIRCLK